MRSLSCSVVRRVRFGGTEGSGQQSRTGIYLLLSFYRWLGPNVFCLWESQQYKALWLYDKIVLCILYHKWLFMHSLVPLLYWFACYSNCLWTRHSSKNCIVETFESLNRVISVLSPYFTIFDIYIWYNLCRRFCKCNIDHILFQFLYSELAVLVIEDQDS